jgi:DNA-binding CsgD family transcriptional regulator
MPPTSAAAAIILHDVPILGPLDRGPNHAKGREWMALLALSHTQVEHRVYQAMRKETSGIAEDSTCVSIRRLLALSGLRSYGSVKRACVGLIEKRSIDAIDRDSRTRAARYRVFAPKEIFDRRIEAGLVPYPEAIRGFDGNSTFEKLIHRVLRRADLTRREVLVVLCCAEGLTNAEIGERLKISEKTVKSHMRAVFDKFGVRRRTELVSCLLTQKKRQRKTTDQIVA